MWWLSGDISSGYAAMGDGGNIIYVNLEKHMVVAITALFIPKAGDRISFIKEWVEPVF